MASAELPLLMLLLLGGLHGINPAMGWLFAVSLGLQHQDRRAVIRALGPLALGHGLAIALVVVGAAAIGIVVPTATLRWFVAATLVGFGLLQLVRHWHPRGGGMRVGFRDLTTWSFLMATGHGAGLMALPFALQLHSGSADGGGVPHAHPESGDHAHHLALAGIPGGDSAALLATLVHSVGYLLVAGAVALVIYEKVGLRILRSAWINLNLIWAFALILTGLLTPFLG
jgi:hypothetical protein